MTGLEGTLVVQLDLKNDDFMCFGAGNFEGSRGEIYLKCSVYICSDIFLKKSFLFKFFASINLFIESFVGKIFLVISLFIIPPAGTSIIEKLIFKLSLTKFSFK